MKGNKPKAQLILDYNIYFGIDPPLDRISIIKNIAKKNVLFEIVALNYRLKPKDKVLIDSTLERQITELEYFTQTPELFKKYSQVASLYTKSKTDFPNIFNRQACLFAIEEIINSDQLQDSDDFKMGIDDWEAIIKYLLAVNFEITQIKKEKDDKNVSFESLNPKLLPLNELNIETDQFLTPYRGFKLLEYFMSSVEYGAATVEYIKNTYDMNFDEWFFHLTGMYMANDTVNPEHNFFYQVKDADIKLFEILSKRFGNLETHKLIDIRKSPFIKIEDNKYALSDNSFLIDKCYSQFLNDFWFDYLKNVKDERGKVKFNISHYRSKFGYFFEGYLSEVLRKCFENYHYSKLLMFDDLKVQTKEGQVEIADLYFRCNSKIILGQVKSGSIYDVEKFGGDMETLYKSDRNRFFENFGVNQLVSSLELMDNYMTICDDKFPKGHQYEVYPCVIVNDKALQTPLMANVFNIRFQELVANYNKSKVLVRPMTLLHISDIEKLEEHLNLNPKKVWDLLKFNFRDKRFIPPFYHTLNLNIRREYPEKIMTLFSQLIKKYNPTGEDALE